MRISVSNIGPASPEYPYTHRLEFSGDHDNETQVKEWLDQSKIRCCIVPYQDVSGWTRTVAVYLNEPELTAFLLKWA